MHVREEMFAMTLFTFTETFDERLLQALCILTHYATSAAEHYIIRQGNKKRAFGKYQKKVTH